MSNLTPPPAFPSGLIAAIAYFLGRVPLKVRTSIYELVILLAGISTLLILLFPYTRTYGVEIPARPVAILTGVLALLASLARSNIFKQVMLEADAAPQTVAGAVIGDLTGSATTQPLTYQSEAALVGPSEPVPVVGDPSSDAAPAPAV